MSVRSGFSKFAKHVSGAIGSPYAFAIACATIIAWAFLGPIMGFSERWQLLINTGTTIATFLVVFLIQTSQNRDAKAVHLKLDELIHVISKARNKLIDCEDLTDEELEQLDREFKALRAPGRTQPHPLAEVAQQQ
jgi:low affinity Fe/Cu permease